MTGDDEKKAIDEALAAMEKRARSERPKAVDNKTERRIFGPVEVTHLVHRKEFGPVEVRTIVHRKEFNLDEPVKPEETPKQES